MIVAAGSGERGDERREGLRGASNADGAFGGVGRVGGLEGDEERGDGVACNTAENGQLDCLSWKELNAKAMDVVPPAPALVGVGRKSWSFGLLFWCNTNLLGDARDAHSGIRMAIDLGGEVVVVEAIELEDLPLGEDAGNEQGVLEVLIFFPSRDEVGAHQLLVVEIAHCGNFWLGDVRVPL